MPSDKDPEIKHREDMLDEALDESFPASDPVELDEEEDSSESLPGNNGKSAN